MAEKWYFAKAGEGIGPFSASQMGKLIKNGIVSSDELVWKQGSEESLKATNFRMTPPPLPPNIEQPILCDKYIPSMICLTICVWLLAGGMFLLFRSNYLSSDNSAVVLDHTPEGSVKTQEESNTDSLRAKTSSSISEVYENKNESNTVKHQIVKQNEWVDLLSTLNLDTQKIHGKWEFNEGKLSSLEPYDYGSIKFPYSETENYEIEAEFVFTPDYVSYEGVLISVPVGASRTRIEIYQDWCILREVEIPQKPEDWSNTSKGWWEDFQNGRKYGSYKPEERALGYGAAEDGWRFKSENGKRVKVNINVTKHKEQHRIEVRLNGHKTHDWTTSANQFSENQEPHIWRQHSKEGIALATGWDGKGRSADFYSLRVRKTQ